MAQLEKGKVTICIVNYKTEELTRLCLRSIRKFTKYPYEVIVVDNNSADSSLEYLRSLKWIKLIERPDAFFESVSLAHGTAVDLGLKATTTEFFLAMHSDTFVYKSGWLTWLVDQMKTSELIACAGSGKLDLKPKWEVLLKKATDYKKWIKLIKADNRSKLSFYIRSICAIYRTEILKKENLTFSMVHKGGFTCAQKLYADLLNRNYKTAVISEYKMAEFIHHLAHATMVLNPEFSVKDRTTKKCKKKIEKIFGQTTTQDILNDNSLDQ